MKTCAECGQITIGVYCDEHTPEPRPRHRAPDRRTRPSSTSRGYGTAWRKTSERARAAQPWCTDCGKTAEQLGAPLELDHTPEAWAWASAHPGKSIPLNLVTVRCHQCNVKAGAARGANVTRPARAGVQERLAAATGTNPGGWRFDAHSPTPARRLAKLALHMGTILN